MKIPIYHVQKCEHVKSVHIYNLLSHYNRSIPTSQTLRIEAYLVLNNGKTRVLLESTGMPSANGSHEEKIQTYIPPHEFVGHFFMKGNKGWYLVFKDGILASAVLETKLGYTPEEMVRIKNMFNTHFHEAFADSSIRDILDRENMDLFMDMLEL